MNIHSLSRIPLFLDQIESKNFLGPSLSNKKNITMTVALVADIAAIALTAYVKAYLAMGACILTAIVCIKAIYTTSKEEEDLTLLEEKTEELAQTKETLAKVEESMRATNFHYAQSAHQLSQENAMLKHHLSQFHQTTAHLSETRQKLHQDNVQLQGVVKALGEKNQALTQQLVALRKEVQQSKLQMTEFLKNQLALGKEIGFFDQGIAQFDAENEALEKTLEQYNQLFKEQFTAISRQLHLSEAEVQKAERLLAQQVQGNQQELARYEQALQEQKALVARQEQELAELRSAIAQLEKANQELTTLLQKTREEQLKEAQGAQETRKAIQETVEQISANAQQMGAREAENTALVQELQKLLPQLSEQTERLQAAKQELLEKQQAFQEARRQSSS